MAGGRSTPAGPIRSELRRTLRPMHSRRRASAPPPRAMPQRTRAVAEGRQEDPEAPHARGLAPVGGDRLRAARNRADRDGQRSARDRRSLHICLLPDGPPEHQRRLSPGQLAARRRTPLDAPPRPHDDLRADRRHLHAVRAPGHGGHVRRRDPGHRLGLRGGRRDPEPRLVGRAEVVHLDRLHLDRLGGDRGDAPAVGQDRPARASGCWRWAARSTRSAPLSTRPGGPIPAPRSSATTRSSTRW